MARLLERSQERYVPPYDLALACLSLGDLDESWVWLQKAFEARDPKMAFLKVIPQWRAFQEHPGFAELMAAMNFPLVN